MKIRLVIVFVVSVLVLSACAYSFPNEIKSSGMDQSYALDKMQVDEPVAQQSLYFIRALFASIDDNNNVHSVQGVKVKWSYLGGDYVTTFPLNKVKWVVDSSVKVPQFKIDWDKYYLNDSSLIEYYYLFQNGGSFNPNDILENQKYYSQVVISLNQADYDLVMSYIFK